MGRVTDTSPLNETTRYPVSTSGGFILMKEDAPQREHSLRALFNALRWMVRAGCPWRMMPHNFPPWTAVHQQTQPLDSGWVL
jgi:transposase